MVVVPPEPSWRPAHLRPPPTASRRNSNVHPAAANGHAHEHAANGNNRTRASARLQGVPGVCDNLFSDPEAAGRQIRLKASRAARLSQGGDEEMDDAPARLAQQLDAGAGERTASEAEDASANGHANGHANGYASAAVGGRGYGGMGGKVEGVEGAKQGTSQADGASHHAGEAVSNGQHLHPSLATSNGTCAPRDSLVKRRLSHPDAPQVEDRHEQQPPKNRLKKALAAAATAAAAAVATSSPLLFSPTAGCSSKETHDSHAALPPHHTSLTNHSPTHAQPTYQNLPNQNPPQHTYHTSSQAASEPRPPKPHALGCHSGANGSSGAGTSKAAGMVAGAGAPAVSAAAVEEAAVDGGVQYFTATPEAVHAAGKLLRYICRQTLGWSVDALVHLHTVLTERASHVRDHSDRVEVLHSMRRVVKKYLKKQEQKEVTMAE